MNLPPSMGLRAMTAGALGVLVVLALYCQGWILWGLLVLMSTAALWEFYSLFKSRRELLFGRVFGLAIGVLMLLAAHYAPQDAGAVLLGAVPLMMTVFLFSWARDNETLFVDIAFILAGVCYVPFLLVPVLSLSMHEQLFLIGTTVATDTAGYLVGCVFGRHRIWPTVSPGKSVEGCLAGMAASMLWACLMGYFYGVLSWGWYLVIGAVLGVVAMLGDFFESALKRSVDVKDSGCLLPGHGGVLDRLDSLLFVIPAYAFATFFVTVFK